MQLSEYLKKHQISQETFARKVGSSQAVISAIISTRRPGYALAQRIEEATDGVVTFEELIFYEQENHSSPQRHVLAGT